jgi:hypothetical protein
MKRAQEPVVRPSASDFPEVLQVPTFKGDHKLKVILSCWCEKCNNDHRNIKKRDSSG